MNAKLRASLKRKLNDWIDEECESEAWYEEKTFVGPRLTDLMTTAAETVFDAQVDVNRYFEREKTLK